MTTVKVHKFRNDDPTEKYTACGLALDVDQWGNSIYRRPVDADARKTTCGNCQRATGVPVMHYRRAIQQFLARQVEAPGE